MPEPAGWPRVLVVTDRRRLARQTGSNLQEWPGLLIAQVAGALAGGADLVQVREPDLDARILLSFLQRLFSELPGSSSRVVVNDRADVAWVGGAAGVHLAERSLSVACVRRLPPGRDWVVGRSVHAGSRFAETREATYLLAGTVRPSESKPAWWRTLGWEGLTRIVQMADKHSVVAIGGLGPGDAAAVRRAGAVGIGAIGLFVPESRQRIEHDVERRVRALRVALDAADDARAREE